MWLGAGAVSAGIAAAMIAGAAVAAAADTDSPSGDGAPSSEQSSQSASPDAPRDDAPEAGQDPDDQPGAGDEDDPAGNDAADDEEAADLAADDLDNDRDGRGGGTQTPAAQDDDELSADEPTEEVGEDSDSVADLSEPETEPAPAAPTRTQQTRRLATPAEGFGTTAVENTAPEPHAEEATSLLAQPPTMAVAAPKPRPASLLELVSAVLFNTITAVERLVTGPPILPPNSSVTVRSSKLQVADGVWVPANWYYPEGDDPPERMILLQHGFFAIGPMYSFTAAALAERTHSIVVTPTLTSNPLAVGGMWLGGNGMHRAVADLFLGDRSALTASAVAAGYAERYGLDPATAALPRKFALAGHSLGGGLVSGTAGYLADNGAAADLVGVILLDGVPRDDQLSSALFKLDAHERATGHFVPVREIGAPWNVWNSTSHVNEELSQARPGRYVGVVLRGGVHMDAMRGGNPLIQLAAYLAAGFPQPQNPPAVIDLSVAWLDDWFEGRTDVGDDLLPGSTIVIPTPEGPARGVVIGDAAAPAVVPGRSLVNAA